VPFQGVAPLQDDSSFWQELWRQYTRESGKFARAAFLGCGEHGDGLS